MQNNETPSQWCFAGGPIVASDCTDTGRQSLHIKTFRSQSSLFVCIMDSLTPIRTARVLWSGCEDESFSLLRWMYKQL